MYSHIISTSEPFFSSLEYLMFYFRVPKALTMKTSFSDKTFFLQVSFICLRIDNHFRI